MAVEDDSRLWELSLSPSSRTATATAPPASRAARRIASPPATSRAAAEERELRRAGSRRQPGRHRQRKPGQPAPQHAAAPRLAPERARSRHGAPPPTRRRRRARRRKPRSFLYELPGIVLTALTISVLIKTFFVQAFYIPSPSMEQTLLINDRVLVNKLVDKPDEVGRGDVVVFHDPGGWLPPSPSSGGGISGLVRSALVFIGLAPATGEEDLIKRVIGVGGDRVRCCDAADRITVNGVPLIETYLYPGDQPSLTPFDVKVPTGKIWVMGDHRTASSDSRAHQQQPGASGFVPVDNVIGRAFTIIWPVNRITLLNPPETFLQPALRGGAR